MFAAFLPVLAATALAQSAPASPTNSTQQDTGAQVPSTSGDWALVWQDEFCCRGPGVRVTGDERSSGGIDASTWTFDIGNGPGGDGWGNNEPQWYTDRSKNAFISTDVAKDRCVLALHAEAEDYMNHAYTSARINTSRHPLAGNILPPRNADGEFIAGGKVRVEARAQLPVGTEKGTWPAFWMLPNNPQRPWPQSGEIDIMEAFKQQTVSMSALHFGGPGLEQRSFLNITHDCSTASEPCADEYHTWAVEWEVVRNGSARLTFFLDDQAQGTVSSSEWFVGLDGGAQDSNPLAPFNRPFYILLNLAVGDGVCDLACVPDKPGDYSQTFIVDWVRLWQSPASSVASPLTLDNTCSFEVGAGTTLSLVSSLVCALLTFVALLVL